MERRLTMNEKLKEIATKAKVEHCVSHVRLQEFAELIVQECITQCEKNKDHEWLGPGSKLSASNIKEHFGVEE